MPADILGAWLGDTTLSQLASRGVCDPSTWAQRYDPRARASSTGAMPHFSTGSAVRSGQMRTWRPWGSWSTLSIGQSRPFPPTSDETERASLS